jgi:7-cyano-7-deazaguanine reductase
MSKQKKAAVQKKSKSKTPQSGRPDAELGHLGLGSEKTDYNFSYNPKLLEVFPNKNPQNIAWTSFIGTEFTSLCPKTGQPDFARIFINYVADELMVESKSLKLYLFSFRNHGDFHEDCIQKICNDLTQLMKPKYIEVIGEFTPRGGISIFPFASQSNQELQFKKLRERRFEEYAPGKFSTSLAKLYGHA